ncbi:MAG: hemerythrin domain-containing protein [Bacteroidota bacterium]
MNELNDFFEGDHRRLEDLLNRATADLDNINMETFAEFRKGMLRHISMEEKSIIPALVEARGGNPLHIVRQVKLEHGAIVALLVPPPGRGVISVLRQVLAHHHHLEEGAGGLYESCERITGDRAQDVLKKAKAIPEVPVLPHNPDLVAYQAAIRTLARAGYEVTEGELKA